VLTAKGTTFGTSFKLDCSCCGLEFRVLNASSCAATGRMFSAASTAAMSTIGGRSFEPTAMILLCIWLSVEDVLTGVDMMNE
ncbi:hypothetical protein Tco_1347427, partial [Tanacetum coccineum]